jgi:hypothetical protein
MDRVNPPTFEVYFACGMSGLRGKWWFGGLTGFRQIVGFESFDLGGKSPKKAADESVRPTT